MFITRKHISRRTVLRGMGVTMALPLLEAMVPARTALAKTAAGKVRLRGHRNGARVGRRHQVRPPEEPVVAGGGGQELRPVAEQRSRPSSRSATT